jgi:hypothetical protein
VLKILAIVGISLFYGERSSFNLLAIGKYREFEGLQSENSAKIGNYS